MRVYIDASSQKYGQKLMDSGKEKGLLAFDIKRKRNVNPNDLSGLKAFGKDYDVAELYLIYGGDHENYYDNIMPIRF